MSQLKNTTHFVPSFRSGSSTKPFTWLCSHTPSSNCCTVLQIYGKSSSSSSSSVGATARGGPWPPIQYASRSLGPLLCLSIHYTHLSQVHGHVTQPSHSWSSSSSCCIQLTVQHLFWDCCVLHSFYMPKPSYLWEISHNNLQQHNLQSHLKHHYIHWGAFNWSLNQKRSAHHVTWSRGYSQYSSSTVPFFTMCCCDRVLPHRSLQHFQMLSTLCAALHMDKHLVNFSRAMPSCLNI